METLTRHAPGERAAGKVLLVGHPNVGKSVLFNRLSGSSVTVSNYPGTTVDLEQSIVALADGWNELVDTPGTRSLVSGSDDERVTLRCLLDNPAAPVVQVGDAKNLQRTLFLTSQLIELERPLVLALNMLDECREARLEPRRADIERALGVPVCPTTATTGEGVDGLEEAIAMPSIGTFRITYPRPIEDAIEAISARLDARDDAATPGKRGLALLYLCGDATIEAWIEDRCSAEDVEALAACRRAARAAVDDPLPLVIHQARFDQVARLARETLVPAADRRRLGAEVASAAYYFAVVPLLGALAGLVTMLLLDFLFLRFVTGEVAWLEALAAVGLGAWFLRRGLQHRARGLSGRESLGELAVFPSTALPLLVVSLYAAYLVVGVFAAGTCVDFIESKLFAPVAGGPGFDVGLYLPLSEAFTEDGEMLGWSLFHVPWKGINYYLAAAAGSVLSDESMLYQLFFGPPASAGENATDMGLVTVGLTYSIAIVLPIVTLFFLVFSLLEDSGFLPRIAVLTDRSLKLMGLNGKAVLPLILGLGCDTMATMTTRILETRKERMVAILLLALAVPCSAQLGIIAGVTARVSPFCLFLFVVIVVAQLLIVGSIAARFFGGRASDFIIEVPPIRRPLLRNVFSKTYSRMKWFLIEAVPLFLLGTFILFVVDRLGVIPALVDLGEPVVTGLLGLPGQSTIGFLLGFLRRDFGAVHILRSFTEGDAEISGDMVRQVLVAVVVITLFVPCLANYFMMIREQGARIATAMSAFIFPYAILVGAVLHQALKLIPDGWLVKGS